MLTQPGRKIAAHVVIPLGRFLGRLGVTPNMVTLAGTTGVVLCSVIFVARGQILLGGWLIVAFALADMLDGAIARATNQYSKWGAFLDSTCDRIADGAVFATATYWLATEDRPIAVAGGLAALVLGAVVPYVRARGEAVGVEQGSEGGFNLAGRTERLVILGFGGLGAVYITPGVLDVVLWLIAALSAITIVHRSRAIKGTLDFMESQESSSQQNLSSTERT